MAGDHYWYDHVKLLLPMTGVDNGTAFNDLSNNPKMQTVVGNTKTVTSQTDPFGAANGVAYVDGAGDELDVASHEDFAIGTEDFTVEYWYRPDSPLSGQNIFDFRPIGVNGAYLVMFLGVDGSLVYYVSGADRITAPAASIAADMWNHVAVCRGGTSTRLFVNGVQVGSTYIDSTTYLQSGLRIGVTAKGYYSGVRVTVGVARYTANFAPPSAPFPNYNAQLSGTVSADLAADEFVAEAYQASDGALSGRKVFTGSAFSVDIKTSEKAHYLTVKPNVGAAWKASTPYALNGKVFPGNPVDKPYYYTAIASGISGATEPNWPITPGQTVSDGGITWECVERLVQPITHGPLIPS